MRCPFVKQERVVVGEKTLMRRRVTPPQRPGRATRASRPSLAALAGKVRRPPVLSMISESNRVFHTRIYSAPKVDSRTFKVDSSEARESSARAQARACAGSRAPGPSGARPPRRTAALEFDRSNLSPTGSRAGRLDCTGRRGTMFYSRHARGGRKEGAAALPVAPGARSRPGPRCLLAIVLNLGAATAAALSAQHAALLPMHAKGSAQRADPVAGWTSLRPLRGGGPFGHNFLVPTPSRHQPRCDSFCAGGAALPAGRLSDLWNGVSVERAAANAG